jgi:hypothetical protein
MNITVDKAIAKRTEERQDAGKESHKDTISDKRTSLLTKQLLNVRRKDRTPERTHTKMRSPTKEHRC